MKFFALILLSAGALLFPLAGVIQGFVSADCCCTAAAAGCHAGDSAQSGVCPHGTCTCPVAFPALILPSSLRIGTPAAAPVRYLAFRSAMISGPDLAPEPPPPRA